MGFLVRMDLPASQSFCPLLGTRIREGAEISTRVLFVDLVWGFISFKPLTGRYLGKFEVPLLTSY